MKRSEKSPIDLFEEAVFLLRTAPSTVLAAYYVGALPFILGLLFFWADMSQNSSAYEHCAPAALGLGILYCWMIYWHAAFVRGLHAELAGGQCPPWSSTETRRAGLQQIIVQPTKLFVLPVAALTVLSYAAAYSFYQNLMAVTAEESTHWRSALRAAGKQSDFWQLQNWVLLLIQGFLSFVVFLNIATAILLLPILLKVMLGIETVFSRSGSAAMNTTLFAVTAGLTYLVTNPLAKAVYLTRYFYAESRATGDDLRAELKTVERAVAIVLRCILAAALLLPVVRTPIHAQPASQSATVSNEQLNHAIDEVIRRPEFTWRMPRPPHPPNTSNWFVRMTEDFISAVGRGARQIGHWVEMFFDWLGRQIKHLFGGLGGNAPSMDSGKLRALIYTLLAGVALVLAWLFWQVRRSRKNRAKVEAQAVAIPVVELNNPDLQADQQPLDEWLILARDCAARGEYRLALRAFYLAGLSHLAGRSLISIQRGKTNKDYARELRRRARDRAELLAAFHQNLGVFEKTWYGMYDVGQGDVEQFETTLSRMRADAN